MPDNNLRLEAEEGFKEITDSYFINLCKEYNELVRAVGKAKKIKKILEHRFSGQRVEVPGVCRIDFSTKLKMEYQLLASDIEEEDGE
ncbi:hypothetical protein M0R01_03925 [bacterium]|nr:hypothetical protein [bacterium]